MPCKQDHVAAQIICDAVFISRIWIGVDVIRAGMYITTHAYVQLSLQIKCTNQFHRTLHHVTSSSKVVNYASNT